MSKSKFLPFDDTLYSYVLDNNQAITPVMEELYEITQQMDNAPMQTDRLQARMLQWLIRLRGVKNVLELGTFTGYSALAMASALPASGLVYTCDVNEEWTDIAKKYWAKAHKSHKIKLILAPAMESIKLMKSEKRIFGLIYIDADKENYIQYYNECLAMLRPNGLMVLDNTLWSGKVVDDSINDEETTTIRRLNTIINEDPRVDAFLLPIGDGMTIIRRK